MKNNWYQIADIEEFIQSSRVLVFNSFSSPEQKKANKKEDPAIADIYALSDEEQLELDNILTQAEATLIAKQFFKEKRNKYTEDIEYYITEKRFMKMLEDLNGRMVSNLLHSLVNKGLLETAYDEEHDDFIFWSPEQKDSNNHEEDQKS